MYHQIGHRFDVRLRNLGCEAKKAKTRAKRDRTENLPSTQVAMKKIETKFPSKKKMKSVGVKEEIVRVKSEQREKALLADPKIEEKVKK